MVEEINAKEAHFQIEHYAEWMGCDKITIEKSEDEVIIRLIRNIKPKSSTS